MIDKIIDLSTDFILKNKYIAKKINKKALSEFIKYLLVGFSSSFIELALFYTLYKFLPNIVPDKYYISLLGFSIVMSHVVTLTSNTIAYSVVFVYNYTLQRKWAFKSTANLKKQMILYTLLFVFNLFVSNYIVVLFIKLLTNYIFVSTNYIINESLSVNDLTPLIAKVLSIAVVVSWNFIIYKKVIFKK
jgi:putative flippase GtrA